MAETKKRYFTESELKEMGEETVNSLLKAIEAGDMEKAKKLTKRMHREFFFVHETLRDWITSLLTFIYHERGEEGVYKSMHDAFQTPVEIMAAAYRSQDVATQAKMLAAGFRAHLCPVAIEEDDEKFSVMMCPCGSGGRAIFNNSYEPAGKFARVKKPHKMTFGRTDFPIYCAHCALQDIVPMEKDGYPIWVIDVPEKVGEVPCKYYIYKDPDNIPSRFYERYGLKKPPLKAKK
jgi:hypothetical protein